MKGIFLGVILSEGWNYPSKIDNRPSLAQKKIYLRDAKRSRGLRFIFSEDYLVTKYLKILLYIREEQSLFLTYSEREFSG